MPTSKNRKKPFFIGLNRIMVSLGPLHDGRNCPFKCAFCYVDHGFKNYMSSSPDEIVRFVRSCSEPFDIIYVSGDTDSFGSPRTSIGIKLLEELSSIGVDLLFTTRAVFDDNQLDAIGKIAQSLNRSGRLLFACISIPRLYSGGHLESENTPSPRERIASLQALKSRNAITMLTLRPFLPVILIQEYLEIISLCCDFTDVVLGENWYADTSGEIERQVFQGPTPCDVEFVQRRMDFNTNTKWWKVWESNKIRDAVEKHCEQLGLPFFMRSQPAVEHIRELHGSI